MGKKRKFWIRGAFKKHKEGSLHRQLGIPKDQKIPRSLLTKIKNAKVGKKYGKLRQKIRNPTRTGKRSITVTPLLKKRATLVHTVGRF